MPEGDTVWLTARRLHEALAGRVLTRSDVRVPRYATTNLAGRTVTEVAARGKHLLIRVEGGITVHTHLRMDGSWRVRPARERIGNSHRIRLVLANDAWQAIGYQLGIVEVLRTARRRESLATWARTCSAPTGTRRRRPGGCAPHRRVPSARPCSISATWPVSATCTRPRCCSCAGWTRGGRSARSAGLDALVTTAQRLMDANKERFSQVTTGCAAAGRADLGVRAGRAALPPVRHPDPGRRAGRRHHRADHLLVPALPVLTAAGRPHGWLAALPASAASHPGRGPSRVPGPGPGHASLVRNRIPPATTAIAA